MVRATMIKKKYRFQVIYIFYSKKLQYEFKFHLKIREMEKPFHVPGAAVLCCAVDGTGADQR